MSKSQTGRRTTSLTHSMIAIAGVAGCGVAALLIIYREVVTARFLSALTPTQSAAIIGSVVVATFFMALLAFFVWLARHPSEVITKRIYVFLCLTIVIVGGVLGGMWMLIDPVPQERSRLERGADEFYERNFATATTLFEAEFRQSPDDPAPAYWLARVALARGQLEVAGEYLDRALKRDADFAPAWRGEVVLALLKDPASARELIRGDAPAADAANADWVACIEKNGFLSASFLTATEILSVCPLGPV